MDLRKEAEARALLHEQQNDRRESFRQGIRPPSRRRMPKNSMDTPDNPNETPTIAHLKELDYKWNGARARLESSDFIVPRWVPDEEVAHCSKCNSEFDWVNRKHHCRSCGRVFCEQCSMNRSMLPHEYGYRDPCRVCLDCHAQLEPHQPFLSNNIANHQRANNVDIASTNCNCRRYFNMPFSSTLGSEVRKAAYSTHNLFEMDIIRDRAIPLRLLAEAKGLAFLTVVKGGFIFAPRIGTGLVVARLPLSKGGGWSAPTAIGTMGLSWGAVVGLDVTDYVIILNTVEAVHAFAGSGQLTIGAGLEVAVGPVGRSGSADLHISDTGLAPAYSYSQSRGLFAGLSLEGSLVLARHEVNHRFYGRPVSPAELLYGDVPPPRAAGPLYQALADAEASLPDVQHLRPLGLTVEGSENGDRTRSDLGGDLGKDSNRARVAAAGRPVRRSNSLKVSALVADAAQSSTNGRGGIEDGRRNCDNSFGSKVRGPDSNGPVGNLTTGQRHSIDFSKVYHPAPSSGGDGASPRRPQSVPLGADFARNSSGRINIYGDTDDGMLRPAGTFSSAGSTQQQHQQYTRPQELDPRDLEPELVTSSNS